MSFSDLFSHFKNILSFKRSSSLQRKWDRATRKQVERMIGCRIHNLDLLQLAFRHASSPVCSMKNGLPSNERLEFLGDAVLELVMRDLLYRHDPGKDEGALTKIRSVLASQPVLAQKARELNIGAFINMSPGEEKSGGRHKDSILSDTLEAVIGAVYLDRGLRKSRKFILRIFGDSWEALSRKSQTRNFKGEFLEYCQQLHKKTPVYRITKQEDVEHRKHYTVEVRLDSIIVGVGTGYSKKQAEQRAAEKAMLKMEEEGFR